MSQVSVYTINPLALSNDEMYGSFDPGTHEWQDGILARIMRTICKDESQSQRWVLFDGKYNNGFHVHAAELQDSTISK
jgi:dynein heavy chain, axonemal